jgi:hypothetical protein
VNYLPNPIGNPPGSCFLFRKGRSRGYEFASTVIELIDSEFEFEGKGVYKSSSYSFTFKVACGHDAGPGPSFPSYPLGLTGSLDDMYTPSQQNGVRYI